MNEYKPTNREKAMKTKRGRFWCGCCGAQLVGQYGKCPNCGHIENKKKKKGV